MARLVAGSTRPRMTLSGPSSDLAKVKHAQASKVDEFDLYNQRCHLPSRFSKIGANEPAFKRGAILYALRRHCRGRYSIFSIPYIPLVAAYRPCIRRAISNYLLSPTEALGRSA